MATIPDSHLQSPIRTSLRDYVKEQPVNNNTVPEFLIKMIKSIPIPKNLIRYDSEKCYGILLSSMFNRNKVNTWVKHHINDILDVLLDHVKNHVGDTMEDPMPLKKSFSAFELNIISTKNDFEDIRSYMQLMKSTSDQKWVSIQKEHLGFDKGYMSSQYLLLRILSDWWIFDYDQVMMICDTIASRVFTILFHNFVNPEIPGMCDQDLLISIYTTWDKHFIDMGNNLYNEIKRWESLIQGLLLDKFDPLLHASNFMNWIREDIRIEDHKTIQPMLDLLVVKDLDKFQLSEIHGMYRHWGHPTVNEEEGCKKVKKIAHNRKIPKWKTIKEMVALMKRQFVMSYIGMHGKWPNVSLPQNLSTTPLNNLIKKNSICVNLYSSQFKIGHWFRLKFSKEFDFDYHLDFSDIIDDKAISPLRSEFRGIYNSTKLGYKPKMLSTSRRVLLESLGRKDLDVEGICDKIRQRNVPKDWNIIILHAKEREMKISPRLFAMMVLEMRLYFCVTELNISNTIFRYFPQQTMTMDESELLKRLYTLSSNPDQNAFIPIISSIDFQSWNIHWQSNSTNPFFEILDDLFGTPGLYTYSHSFFRECLISLASHHNPPSSITGKKSQKGDPPSCDTLWYNHNGGFEGLRQKGWTLITICLLLLVEYKTGIKSYIIGQGDNQVCKLMIPKIDKDMNNSDYILNHQQDISVSIDGFLTMLEECARDIGLVIKKDESWVSSAIINYGKDLIFNGAFLPQSSKRISRTMVDVNEIYPALFFKISTLQTSGLSTAQKGFSCIEPYIICQLETLSTILRELYFPIILKGVRYQQGVIDKFSSKEFLSFILHLSSDIGCCPILPLLSYYYRGHPDPLTTYLTQIEIGYRSGCNMCKKFFTYLDKGLYEVGEGDPELLITNPTSLNIKAPTLLANSLRKFLEKTILGYTKNRDILFMFKTLDNKKEKKIYESLIDTTPLYPRVLHEILGQTSLGAKLNFIAKFSNTRTTQMLMKEDKYNLDKKLNILERGLIDHWLEVFRKISMISNYSSLSCPTKLANKLRDDTWKKLVNKPLEGVTIPHPAHQFSINRVRGLNHDNCVGYSEHIYFKTNSIDPKICLETKGPYSPYLGSQTREKVTGKIYQIAQSSRPLHAAQRLIQIKSWCIVPNSDIDEFLDHLIETRTDVPKKILELTSGYITSGSYTHRLNDHSTKRGTLINYRPNSSTHIYVSTDNMGKYSRGQDNYNIHFQGALHLGFSIFEWDLVRGLIPYDTLHLHIICHDCEEKIDDMKISGGSGWEKLAINIENKLLFSKLHYTPVIMSDKSSFYSIVTARNGGHAAGALLASRLIKHINQSQWGITESSFVHISPIGVKEIVKFGIQNILYHCAIFLYLYFFEQKDLLHIMISREMTQEIWRDISQNCLLPEILPDLVKVAGNRHANNLYYTSFGTSQLLNKALCLIILSFKDRLKYEKVKDLVFYLLPGCGIKRLILMWGNYIDLTHGFNPGLQISQLIDISQSGFQLPDHQLAKRIYDFIHKNYQPNQVEIMTRLIRLKISNCPPEIVMARRITFCKPEQTIKRVIFPGGIRPVLSTNSFLTIVSIPEITWSKQLLPNFNSIPKQFSLKKYEDHQYGLVGDLSCSMLKIIEILDRFQVKLNRSSVSIADGEGYIGNLLYKISGRPTYHNSLVDSEKLILHRGLNFIPGAYIEDPSGVKSASISAIYGGDITDTEFLCRFILSIEEDELGLLTFDAESNKPFTRLEKIRFINATRKILASKKFVGCIYKTYCDDIHMMMMTISSFQEFFSEVHVVVPLFSSNETYEVYICSFDYFKNKTITKDGENLYVDSSVISSYDCLVKVADARLSSYPHQTASDEWVDIIKQAKLLGYHWNIDHYCEKLILDFDIFNRRIDIHDWFQTVIKNAESLLLEELYTLFKLEKGYPLSKIQKILMSSGHVFHKSVEFYLVVIYNSYMCLNVMDEANDRSVNMLINNQLKTEFDFKIRGVTLYKYQPNILDWRHKYLKCFWKVIGFIRYKHLFH